MTSPVPVRSEPVAVGRIRIGPEVAHYPPGATFGPRTLGDFEFVWLLSGAARWTGDGTGTDLRPGMLLLVRPGVRDHFAWDPDAPTRHAYVHFDLEHPGTLGDPTGWPLIRRFADTDPTAALCHYLLGLGPPADPGTQTRVRDVMGWLLTLFVQGPAPAEARDVAPAEYLEPIVTRLRVVWGDGTTTPVTLAELAAFAGISPGHLARVFRKRFGVGPVHALELVRLARAATLLQRSNLPVSGVAAACGFGSPFHFTRRFRVVYGAPPRTYRVRSDIDPLYPLARAGLLPLARRLLLDPP